MPWCETCSQFFNPNTLTTVGDCPKCGTNLDSQKIAKKIAKKIPWHFWLLVSAAGIYLGWRLVQGIANLVS